MGLGSLQPAHMNSHGNNSLNKQKIYEMFSNSTISDIRKIVEKYEKDLEICGYDWTLKMLHEIIDNKRSYR